MVVVVDVVVVVVDVDVVLGAMHSPAPSQMASVVPATVQLEPNEEAGPL